jgi:Tfp pilus assembly protein PilX
MLIEGHNRFGRRGVMLIIAVLVITVLVLTAIRLTQSIVANRKQSKLESRKEEE